MPKKKVSKVVKAAVKKVAKKAVKKAAKKVDVVGFRLRMTSATHNQVVKKAAKKGISQNAYINQLIQKSAD